MKTFLMWLAICYNHNCKCEQEIPKHLYNDPYSETGPQNMWGISLECQTEKSYVSSLQKETEM
jgi:hypothetical protein